MSIVKAGTQTEAVLNKLSKPELVQLPLNTETNIGAYINMLTAEIKEINNNLQNQKQMLWSLRIIRPIG